MKAASVKILLLYSLCLVLLFYACTFLSTPVKRNDIYAKCAKGDTISLELFKKVQRIIKTDMWYYIWVDLYEEKDGLVYAEHLLVCDHNLVLKGASGACPDIIEAKGDTLFGCYDERYDVNKNKSVKPYRDDLPKEIIVSIIKKQTLWNGYQRKPFAIVDSIQLLQDSEIVRLYLKTSDSICFPGRAQYFENKEYYSKEFKNIRVLEYPINALHFDRGRKYIYTVENNNVLCEMHTLSDKVFENFIYDIWLSLKY